jgi:hypothetical protein
VRLLLHEQFSPEIARQLRRRGHDVVAVKEQPDRIGRAGRDVRALEQLLEQLPGDDDLMNLGGETWLQVDPPVSPRVRP